MYTKAEIDGEGPVVRVTVTCTTDTWGALMRDRLRNDLAKYGVVHLDVVLPEHKNSS